MDNNNEVYGKKPVIELIEMLRYHKIRGSIVDKQLYEALRIHLSEREITKDEKEALNRILFDHLETTSETNENHLIPSSEENINKSNNTINPDNIVATGKALKAMFGWILIMIICNTIGVFIIFNSLTEINPIEYKQVYKILGAINLICSIIILNNLYTAGDNLEKSIK
jgi:hypothetical protein